MAKTLVPYSTLKWKRPVECDKCNEMFIRDGCSVYGHIVAFSENDLFICPDCYASRMVSRPIEQISLMPEDTYGCASCLLDADYLMYINYNGSFVCICKRCLGV